MAACTIANEDEKEVKQLYVKHFNAKQYLSYFPDVTVEIRFVLGCLHRIFTLEIRTGENLLDIGCGPAVYALISASKRFKTIVVADYLQANLDEISKWRRGDKEAHDWSPFVKCVASLEHETDYKKLDSRLRSSLKDVIPCDVFLENPIAPLTTKFDCVMSNFCLETVATSLESYKRALANTVRLLKPGGKLVMFGLVNSTTIQFVEGVEFPTTSVDKQSVEKACNDVGLECVDWVIRPRMDNEEPGDFTDTFFVLAKKK